MYDMLLKTMQFSNLTLQFRSKMQSFTICTKLTTPFTICTKLTTETQKTKIAKQCKMPIFLYFQYIKSENAWTGK
jgi:hypothetical protein